MCDCVCVHMLCMCLLCVCVWVCVCGVCVCVCVHACMCVAIVCVVCVCRGSFTCVTISCLCQQAWVGILLHLCSSTYLSAKAGTVSTSQLFFFNVYPTFGQISRCVTLHRLLCSHHHPDFQCRWKTGCLSWRGGDLHLYSTPYKFCWLGCFTRYWWLWPTIIESQPLSTEFNGDNHNIINIGTYTIGF